MNGSEGYCLSVVRQPGFDAEAQQIYGSVTTSDLVLHGVEFAVARKPTIGTIVAGTGNLKVYAVAVGHEPTWPPAVVLYTVESTTIILHRIIRITSTAL